MMWLFAIVVVVVLGGVAAVAAGRGEPMAPVYDDRPDALVPAGRPLTAADVRKVRFSVALRGYRMSEVDALLARLAAELEAGSEKGPEKGPEKGFHQDPEGPRDDVRREPRSVSDLVDPPTA